MKNAFRKAFRYGLFMAEYIGERCRGLDFSMPSAGEMAKSRVEYYGYCKTSEGHIKKILNALPMDPKNGRFLDIGCGKGITMKSAKDLGYPKAAGIDLDDNLIEIAQRNMKKLGLEDVECICVNALEYTGYDQFNVFFFFNPFDDTVLAPVVQKILDSVAANPREVYVIYHHPKYAEVMDRAGLTKINTLYDSLRDYDTYIYTLK